MVRGKNTCFQTGDQTQMILIGCSVRRPTWQRPTTRIHAGKLVCKHVKASTRRQPVDSKPLVPPNPLHPTPPCLPSIYSSPFGSCLVKSSGGEKQLTRGLKSSLLTGNWTFSPLDSCLVSHISSKLSSVFLAAHGKVTLDSVNPVNESITKSIIYGLALSFFI